MLNWKCENEKRITIHEDCEGEDRYNIDPIRAEFLLMEFGKKCISYEYANNRTMPENIKLKSAYELCDCIEEYLFMTEVIFKANGINALLEKLQKVDLPLAAMIQNLMNRKKEFKS